VQVDANERNSNRRSLGRDVALYTTARLAILAAVAGVLLLLRVPLVVALAVAVVVALPLSLVVLRGMRRRVAEGMAERAAERRAHRERLHAQLRGEEPPDAG
jgi:Flp pilus assembly protein TadB